MKIVIAAKSVYPFHPVGGVQKYVYYFAKHLVQQGVDVEIVAPLDDGRPRTEVYDGIKYTLLYPSISSYLELPVGWFGVHWFGMRLAKYLKDKQFDILHSFDMAGLYYLDVPAHKPVIAHIFSDNFLISPVGVKNYLSLFGYKPESIKKSKIMLSPFADMGTIAQYPAQYLFKAKPMHKYLAACVGVFIEAECFREDVAKLYRLDPTKLHIVPVGVDVAYVRERMAAATLDRAALGLNPSDTVLLTVNRLAADKGIDSLIKAMPHIRSKVPSIKLLIVGKGYMEAELNALIETMGEQHNVRIVKDVREEDLYGYYKISDIYVSAFSFPGSSVSTMEAMAAALPIVTTAQSWLVANGDNGAYDPNNSPEALAQAIVSVAGRNLKSQGAMSDSRVQSYDWSNISQNAIRIYKSV